MHGAQVMASAGSLENGGLTGRLARMALAAVAVALASLAAPAAAQTPAADKPQVSSQKCLSCHDDPEMKDDDGKSLSWGTECAGCRKPWDRYVGKRKCYTCGVPVLVCDACMSRSTSSARKKKKGRRKRKNAKEGEEEAAQSAEKDASGGVQAVDVGPRREEGERIRCPLCIEEGVTVPAEEVEYTDNGVRGKLRSSSFAEDGGFDEDSGAAAATCKPAKAKDDDARKAARSVCKWGGGHAARKKEKRKFSRRPCQFGSDCARKDCFFYHPE